MGAGHGRESAGGGAWGAGHGRESAGGGREDGRGRTGQACAGQGRETQRARGREPGRDAPPPPTSFNASKLVLICRPSILVVLSVSALSTPRSLPARSISDSLPITSTALSGVYDTPSPSLTMCCRSSRYTAITACERDEVWFAPVDEVVRAARPADVLATNASISSQ